MKTKKDPPPTPSRSLGKRPISANDYFPLRFRSALEFCIQRENEIPWDKNFPGPRRMLGASQEMFSRYLEIQGLTPRSLAQLTGVDSPGIHWNFSWIPCRCHQIRDSLALALLDTSILLDSRRAIRFLQGLIGANKNGEFGSFAFEKLLTYSQDSVALRMVAARANYFNRLAQIEPLYGIHLDYFLDRGEQLREHLIQSHQG